MTQDKLPTVDELNAIQKQWMQCDSSDQKQAKAACREMKRCPEIYLSVNKEKTKGLPVWNFSPVWAAPQAIEQARQWMEQRATEELKTGRARLDVYWCAALGKWVAAEQEGKQ